MSIMLNATLRATEAEYRLPRNAMLSTSKASQRGLSMARYEALSCSQPPQQKFLNFNG